MRTPLNTLESANRVRRRRALSTIALLGATLAINSCGASYGSTTTNPTPSSDASLSALAINSGILTPVFAPATTSYTASVSNGTAFEVVTPTTGNPSAKVTVEGVELQSGTASKGIPLAVGANTITVVVTAQDLQTTRTYTIVVTRVGLS